jgi:hypothetical protein
VADMEMLGHIGGGIIDQYLFPYPCVTSAVLRAFLQNRFNNLLGKRFTVQKKVDIRPGGFDFRKPIRQGQFAGQFLCD